MSEIATQVQEPVTPTEQQPVQVDINQQLAASMWGEQPVKQQEAPPAVVETTSAAVVKTEEVADEILDVDDYFTKNFGVDATTAKTEWEEYRKSKNNPQTPTEVQFANEESKKLYEAIKAGKNEDVYNLLDRQRNLDRLEKYEVNNAGQAAEIIKANLKFKHGELTPQQIDRLFTRQYSMPEKPIQSVDQDDADYAIEIENWSKQVQEKEQDMIIDATLAKPELLKHKSPIVFPEIENKDAALQVDQKELEAKQQAAIENFKKSLESGYQNFKGFSITAKDGDVQLPINYAISPEELTASKEDVATFNLNEFFDKRWFDAQGNPNITLIQEDLYLLKNRDKVFQKIANEAAAQRFLHHQKIQNNIKLNGVNQEIAPSTVTTKTVNETLAEKLWN